MRFFNYGRKSVFSDKSDSISNQFRMCREHCEARFPGQIDSWTEFSDEAFTGANTDRPSLQRMLAEIRAGSCDVLVVYQLDRLSRDVRDFSNLYSLLEDHGVKFLSVKESIDTSTPIGRAMMYVTAVFAQMERETIAARVSDNMTGLAKKGYWTGGPAPVGYQCGRISSGEKNHSLLVPAPDGREYVNWIYDMFLESGSSIRRLRAAFVDRGILSSNGRPMSTSCLYNLLTCPFYAAADGDLFDYYSAIGCRIDAASPREIWDGSHGVMVYGRLAKAGDSRKRLPPEKWTVCIGAHEPLLSSDKWLAAQRQFKENTFDKTSRNAPTLLKSVVRCRCGRLMHVSRQKRAGGRKIIYYDCSTRRELGSSVCDAHQIPAEKLDGAVLEIFRKISADPGLIRKYTEAGRDNSGHVLLLREKEKRARSLEAGIENLAASLSEGQGASSVKYVYAQMDKMDLELSALKREVADLKIKESENKRAAASAEESARRIRDLVEKFDGFSAWEKNEIVKDVVRECVWDGETLFLKL